MLEALERHGMEVMYAREKHGNTGDAEEWKMTAFSSLVRTHPAPIRQQKQSSLCRFRLRADRCALTTTGD